MFQIVVLRVLPVPFTLYAQSKDYCFSVTENGIKLSQMQLLYKTILWSLLYLWVLIHTVLAEGLRLPDMQMNNVSSVIKALNIPRNFHKLVLYA